MHSLNDGPLRLLIKQSRTTFDGVCYLLENDDLSSATLLAKKLADYLQSTTEAIKSQNITTDPTTHKLLSRKFSQLSEDRKILDSVYTINVNRDAKLDRAELDAIISLMGEYIDLMEHSVPKFNPLNQWKEWIQKNIRRIAQMIFASAIVVAVVLTWQHLYYQKHSLVGEYYNDVSFQSLYAKRLDRQIDFDWGFESPLWHFRKDFFSIRWAGYLDIPKAGNYQFATRADDGVRLWIDDQLIIDDWTAHSARLNTGNTQLTQGYHKIKLEYFEYNYLASVSLYWKSEDGLRREIISPKYFISNERYIHD